VRQPKELQDLQRESEALARHLHTLEDRLLQTMVDVEDAEADHARAQNEKEQADRQAAQLSGALEGEMAQLEERLASLASTREAVTDDVLEDDLALYNLLHDQHGGVAVARLEDDACNACGLALSASMPQLVRQGSGLVRCPQCGRVLYAG
ncbi:MAG: zinc ribbon domain-containing protein, partial [Anaerolineales bacterium]